MRAISLFSGAGGMDVGFRAAGFNIVWANDVDRYACESYQANHGQHIRCGDLNALLPDLEKVVKEGAIACLFGGPPCQGFSVAGKMDANDPRSKLVWAYMTAVKLCQPDVFVMENVKALAQLKKFSAIRDGLLTIAGELGYSTELVVLNARDFGVPQSRERMFLVGVKGHSNGFEQAVALERADSPPVRDVLVKVGRVGSAENSRICKAKVTLASAPVLRKSPYAGMLFNGQGRPLNLEGFASTLPASMGGNRTPVVDDGALYEGRRPWVEMYHEHLLNGGTPDGWRDVPKRLRRLTVDEAMALQTFPAGYRFIGSQSTVFRQIGNAVPCNLAGAVARAVGAILRERRAATLIGSSLLAAA